MITDRFLYHHPPWWWVYMPAIDGSILRDCSWFALQCCASSRRRYVLWEMIGFLLKNDDFLLKNDDFIIKTQDPPPLPAKDDDEDASHIPNGGFFNTGNRHFSGMMKCSSSPLDKLWFPRVRLRVRLWLQDEELRKQPPSQCDYQGCWRHMPALDGFKRFSHDNAIIMRLTERSWLVSVQEPVKLTQVSLAQVNDRVVEGQKSKSKSNTTTMWSQGHLWRIYFVHRPVLPDDAVEGLHLKWWILSLKRWTLHLKWWTLH